jgi:predicted ATPase
MPTLLRLTNFKCFASERIDLRPLTLLTGLNGAGKSTVLQSLLLLRQNVLRSMLPAKGLALNGELVNLGTAQNVLYRGASTDDVGLSIWHGGEEFAWKFGYPSPTADVLPILSEPRGIPADPLFGAGFHYLQAERIGPRVLLNTSSFEVRQQRSLGTDGRHSVAFLEAFAKEAVVPGVMHGSGASDLAGQVNAWLGEVSPGAELIPRAHGDLNVVSLRIRFSDNRIVTDDFSAPNVGFGVSYILPVLLAILSSKPGNLVLIENPEAHIHPRGQVAIGRLLSLAASNGITCFVESHSDHVLNGIRLAVKQGHIEPGQVGVHYFDRRVVNDQITHVKESPTIDRDGRLDRWPAGFFDQWESTLDSLLA